MKVDKKMIRGILSAVAVAEHEKNVDKKLEEQLRQEKILIDLCEDVYEKGKLDGRRSRHVEYDHLVREYSRETAEKGEYVRMLVVIYRLSIRVTQDNYELFVEALREFLEHELGALCNEYIDSIDPVYEKFIKERFSGLFVEGEHDKSGV